MPPVAHAAVRKYKGENVVRRREEVMSEDRLLVLRSQLVVSQQEGGAAHGGRDVFTFCSLMAFAACAVIHVSHLQGSNLTTVCYGTP